MYCLSFQGDISRALLLHEGQHVVVCELGEHDSLVQVLSSSIAHLPPAELECQAAGGGHGHETVLCCTYTVIYTRYKALLAFLLALELSPTFVPVLSFELHVSVQTFKFILLPQIWPGR